MFAGDPRKVASPQDSESSPMAGAPGARRKRIVIVGAGFAGVAAARGLKRCDADVVLIDRRNHNIFQPLLYRVATAVLASSEIAGPIRQLAKKQKSVNVMLAEVTGVDLNSRPVEAALPGIGGRKIQFDYLVIAAGMRARLGFRASHLASTAAEPVAGTNPVVLVVPHRAAQLTIDPGAAVGGNG